MNGKGEEMKSPVIAKVAGIITLLQITLSIMVGVAQGISGVEEVTITTESDWSIILLLVLSGMIALIISSIMLIIGKKSARILYLVSTIINLAGNIYVAGIECGILSSFITILFSILLYTRKSAREFYSKKN